MIRIASAAGDVVECRHVIVTVPLLALQHETIRFSPALPASKTGAISRVKMSNAVKVVQKWWHLAAHLLTCGARFVGHNMVEVFMHPTKMMKVRHPRR
jgi:hypothetical protein